MTTYDDNLLAARFAALAPGPLPGDWDEVLDKAGIARGGRRFAGPRVARRRRLLVVFAAVALVAVLAASAFAVRTFVLDRGLVGLPPVGATPSAPETGELVLAAYVFSAEVGRIRLWAYSDGRFISFPQRKGPSGWVEQRLTAEGVERLRSEITSTGLFDNDRKLGFDGGPYGQPCFNFVRVRNGDPLAEVAWSAPSCPPEVSVQPAERATPEQAEILVHLVERLADPESWLPAESWEQREPRGYVPSRFAVCYGASAAQAMERSRALSLLPAGARALLGDKDVFDLSGLYSGGPGDIRPTTDYCSDVTVDEARRLAEALDAGAPTNKGGSARLNYEFAAPAPSRETVAISFEPYLPHGEFICSPCG